MKNSKTKLLAIAASAVLAKCSISEVMKCFQNIDTYGNAVA